MKAYKNNITTNFYNQNGSKKAPEEKILHKCLSIIILGCIFYTYDKYQPKYF